MASILWGSISQVQGPVVDIKFADELPGLRTAIEIINPIFGFSATTKKL